MMPPAICHACGGALEAYAKTDLGDRVTAIVVKPCPACKEQAREGARMVMRQRAEREQPQWD